MKTVLNLLLVLSMIFVTACGDGSKSKSKKTGQCSDGISATTGLGDVDEFFDGEAGHYKLIKIDFYMNVGSGNYVGGKTVFTADINAAISPTTSLACTKMADLPEGEMTLNVQAPVSFDRSTGKFSELYKKTIVKYGPRSGGEDEFDWSVVNFGGSIFAGSGEGTSAFRKGKVAGQFILEIGDSADTELGELKFVSFATYQYVK